jgi:uncharacterized protein YjbI with pentapeptide repeats
VHRSAKATVWVLGAIVLLAALTVGAYFGGKWLWGELAGYIRPRTPTERKDLVNIVVLIGAGIVGTLTAFAAILNAYISSRNLQHAQEALRQERMLDERRAQDDALQAYFNQIGGLLTEHELKEAQPDDAVALLAQAQTLTVLRRLDGKRKRDLLQYVHSAGLIHKDNAVVNLLGADLSSADLSYTPLSETSLSGAILIGANLSFAPLFETNLSDASLRRVKLMGAKLIGADLSNANLNGANLSSAQLNAAILRGATLRHDLDLISNTITSANLTNADFGDADLTGADLTGADLSNAILIGADLSDTILTGTKGWTDRQLMGAKSLEGATMPNGQRYEEWLEDEDIRGWYLQWESRKKPWADQLKDMESRGEFVGSQNIYLAWLKDRESRGEDGGTPALRNCSERTSEKPD